MNEEQFTLFLGYLDKIGVKLGIGVQGIWPWFVKQQYIQAMHSFVLFMISLAVFYFVAKFTRNHWNIDNERNYSIVRENHKETYLVVLVAICCASIFTLLGFIGDLAGIFNPQYYAFKDLVAMMTPDVVKSD